MNDTLIWLDEPACQNVALVGGKVANLSLLAAKYRVPAGFCLTTKALAGVLPDHEADSLASRPAIYEELAAAYQRLAERSGVPKPKVAVRSSAVDEDGLGASFAGQYESYLNVVGVENVAEAVQKCCASAHSARVQAYRQQQGNSFKGRLAVLVQELVMADISAVVFSANPVTGNRQEIVINGSWGLGESIVGGTVTPDSYVVGKSELTIIKRKIAEKQRMTVMLPNGTREVAIPRLMRQQPAMSDAQALEMVQLALRLEEDMGWAVDIECAYQGDKLYLLQCRPITTLHP